MGFKGTVKKEVKTVLMKLWHLSPCNDIYMFHHVLLDPQPELSTCKLSTEDFEKFVSVPRKYASLEAAAEDNAYSGLCAVTFDDGLADVYTVAYPILKAKGIPFTVFVLSRFADQPGYLTADQIREMAADPLVTIAAHGTEHRILTECTPEECHQEIFESKQTLETITGVPCRFFAYSHGQYNENVLALVEEAGYEKAFAVAGRPLSRRFDRGRFAYPRLSVEVSTKRMFRL